VKGPNRTEEESNSNGILPRAGSTESDTGEWPPAEWGREGEPVFEPPPSPDPSDDEPSPLTMPEQATQTIELSSLFTRDVTRSGSFDIRGGIWATTFGKVLQALPIPAFLVDLSYSILVMNQACAKIGPDYEEVAGASFPSLFVGGSAERKCRSLLEEVFSTRVPSTIEAMLEIAGSTIWGRLIFRSIRISEERFILVLVEDLTAERNRILESKKYGEDLEVRVQERTEELRAINEVLEKEVMSRKRAEEELRKAHDDLERQVKERTAELVEANVMLKRGIADRTNAERALRESEEHYRFTMDASLAGIYIIQDLVFKYVNPEMARLMGYTPEEMEHDLGPPDLVVPEQREMVRQNTIRRAKGVTGEPYEIKAIRRDGSTFDAVVQGRPVSYQGRPASVGTLIDISGRKRAEEALKKSEKLYRQLVESANDMIYQTDANGLMTLINPVGLRILGYSSEEVIGEHYRKFIPEDHRDKITRFHSAQFARKNPETYHECPFLTKQGDKRWFGQYTQTMIEHDTVVGFQSIARDITERKLAEEELRRANELQQQLLSTAATAIFIIDSDRIITGVNDEFCSITGFDKGELIGKSCLDFSKEPCDTACGLFEQHTGERILRRQTTIKSKDGRSLTVLTNATQVTNEEGKVVGGIESFVDVTELIEAHRAAEAADRAKGEFLANMSHEIRTPLTAIMGHADLALKADLTPRLRDYLTRMRVSSRSLLGMVNDVLDFSRIEAGKIDVESLDFDLTDVLNDLSDMFGATASATGIDFGVSIEESVPCALVGDPARIEQVLVNLTDNAFKFTESGRIAVKASLLSKDPDRAKIKFSVEDSGVGLSPEEAPKLFESFVQADSSTTRRYGGSGLGLAICRGLVQAMGGEIEVSSEPSKGSTFSFALDLARQPDHRTHDLIVPHRIQESRVTQEEMPSETAEKRRQTFSFDAVSAISRTEALEKLERAEAGPDLELPATLPGIEMESVLNRLGGNRRALMDVLTEFGTHYGNVGEEIKNACLSDQTEVALRLTHTVKGASANISAIDLNVAATDLEKGIRQGNENDFPRLLGEFEKALGQVVQSADSIRTLAEQTRAARVSAAGEVAAPDLSQVEPIVVELFSLLRQNDFKAVQRMESLVELLGDGGPGKKVDSLKESVARFDFNAAQNLVKEIAETLGLRLQGDDT